MQKRWMTLLSVVFILLYSISFGEGMKVSVNHTEDELKQRYQEYYQYMIEKDIEGLRSILSENYQLRHMTGYLQDGEEWLAQIVSGEMTYFSQEEGALSIDVDGDTASIVSQNRVDARIYGSRNTWRLELKHTLQKTDNKWYFVYSEASTYR